MLIADPRSRECPNDRCVTFRTLLRLRDRRSADCGLRANVGETGLEMTMNEETFNLSIRKFLKMVGIKSQHEIEQAVNKKIADSAIAGTDAFPAKMTLEVAGLNINVVFEGEIRLQ